MQKKQKSSKKKNKKEGGDEQYYKEIQHSEGKERIHHNQSISLFIPVPKIPCRSCCHLFPAVLLLILVAIT